MNSFYGGRQGRSFIISKTYESIESMVEDFGNKDCQVNFDEYVLINTKNKNLPEHGNVYRKGYDFNGEIETYHKTVYREDNPYATVRIASNGAEYVGNIAGPAGHAPIFKLDSYEEVMNKIQFMSDITFSYLGFDVNTDGEPDKTAVIEAIIKKQEEEDPALKLESGKDFYVLKVAENNITHYYCYSEKGNTGWYNVNEAPEKNTGSFTIKNDSIIPAVRYQYEEDGTLKYQKNEDGYYYLVKEEDPYNDEIKWVYCTLRDENLQDSIAHIGFQFVAPLFDFQAEFVDTDYDQPLVERNQTQGEIEAHPFYSSWLLKIPKGVKGGQIENLRLINFDSNWTGTEDNIPKDIIFDETNDTFTVSVYSKFEEHKERNTNNEYFQLVVYDFVDYSQSKAGIRYTIYLNEYAIPDNITDIRINEEGKFQFSYESKPGEWYTIGGDFPVSLIETLRYDEETGNLYASYNIPDENGYKERLVGTIDIITPTSVILDASEETVDAVTNANVVVGGSVYIVEEV